MSGEELTLNEIERLLSGMDRQSKAIELAEWALMEQQPKETEVACRQSQLFDCLHPQTIAMIVSHMEPNQGAWIIGEMPPEKQSAVIQSIATMKPTSPEAIEEIKKDFDNWLSNVINQELKDDHGIGCIMEFLQIIDRTTGQNIMKNLAQYSPELVDDLCRLLPDRLGYRLMFEFEDILKLDDTDVQRILRNYSYYGLSNWALPLKGTSEELMEKIYRNMTKRAAKLLQEEYDFLGPQRSCDVERAQQEIIDVIWKLDDRGEVTIRR